MEFVAHYISIQKKLIGDSMHYIKDIKGDIDHTIVPAMIVQILVENSVKHGLKAIEGDKKLTIAIWNDNATTCITVEDNGPGFNCCKQCESSTSTGLKVVRQIIALTNSNNKEKIGFAISNITSPNGNISGCRATLTIPNNIKYITKNTELTK